MFKHLAGPLPQKGCTGFIWALHARAFAEKPVGETRVMSPIPKSSLARAVVKSDGGCLFARRPWKTLNP